MSKVVKQSGTRGQRSIARRTFLVKAAAATLIPAFARTEPYGWDLSTEEQRGDLGAAYEYISINPKDIFSLSGPRRAAFRERAADFGKLVTPFALSCTGKSRSNARPLISQMLELFDLPFETDAGKRPVPFCASGLVYITAHSYLQHWGEEVRFEDLEGVLPEIDHYHFFPSPSVWDMYYVALGKRRWVPVGRSLPKSGWIVVFDFGKGADHVGLVLSANTQGLHTFECNTSGKINGSQQNGGVITTRDRGYENVKGYIRTDLETPV
jgi:hypothetical protein